MRSLVFPAEGWLSLAFSAIVVLSSVWSLQAAAWVEHLEILGTLALVGVLCGFVSAKLPWPSFMLHAAALLLGLIIVPYGVASTLAAHSLRANMIELWNRFGHWLAATLLGGVSTDNLLFLLLVSALVWLTSYYGTWSAFRHHGPWWLILCSGSILIVNLSYARSLDWFALVFLLSSMALVVRVNVAVQEDRWHRSGVQYSSDFPWRLLWISMIAGTVVVVASWSGPTTALSHQMEAMWTGTSGPWQNVESQFSRFFGGVRSKDQANSSSFGNTLALRGSNLLSDTAVLSVGERDPSYLRAVVYDRYTGQGWLAREVQIEQIPANDSRLDADDFALREQTAVTVNVLQPRGLTVLAPAQPLRVGLPVDAEYERDGGPDGKAVDVTVLRSTMMLRRGTQYTAVASVSRAPVENLRSAGNDYPDWVKQRYLSLPQSIPGRVVSLARRLAASAGNPYDKASAIQEYLRSYPYSETVPGPPPGRDVVDFFLFDAKVGYCDYYASAMVVALRLAGVPARIVSGYSSGEFDPSRQVSIIRDSDAHSWPEVFFPRYGWIPFEPTASRPVPLRTESAIALPTPTVVPPSEAPDPNLLEADPKDREASPAIEDAAASGNRQFEFVRPVIAVILSLALAYFLVLAGWRSKFRGLSEAESAFARLSTLGSWVGVGRHVDETPNEYARRLSSLVPSRVRDVESIVGSFVAERFGRQRIGDMAALRRAWRRIRLVVVLLPVRRNR